MGDIRLGREVRKVFWSKANGETNEGDRGKEFAVEFMIGRLSEIKDSPY